MFELLSLGVNSVKGEPHDLDQEQLQQPVAAHEEGGELVAVWGQLDAMVGRMADITLTGQPLEELCH